MSPVVVVNVFVRCLWFPGSMLLVGMEITDLQQPWALRFGSEFQVSPGPLSSRCVVVGLATTATRRPGDFSIYITISHPKGLFPVIPGIMATATGLSTSSPRKCNYIAIFGLQLKLITLRFLT